MKPAIVEGITIRPFTNDKETITAILHHNYSQESLTLDLDVISNASSWRTWLQYSIFFIVCQVNKWNFFKKFLKGDNNMKVTIEIRAP